MSKYKEALDKISNVLKEMANLKDADPICEEEVQLLVSLINNFKTVSKRHDNLVVVHRKACNALEKACEGLESCCSLNEDTNEIMGELDSLVNNNTYLSVEEWKEWCLKDE